MTADETPAVYTMRDFGQRAGQVMAEIVASGKPAFLTRHGRFIAMITPLQPGQVEHQVLAGLTRGMTPP